MHFPWTWRLIWFRLCTCTLRNMLRRHVIAVQISAHYPIIKLDFHRSTLWLCLVYEVTIFRVITVIRQWPVCQVTEKEAGIKKELQKSWIHSFLLLAILKSLIEVTLCQSITTFDLESNTQLLKSKMNRLVMSRDRVICLIRITEPSNRGLAAAAA